jgi:hypothetical protein
MIRTRKVWMVVGIILALALPAWAQRGQGAPQIPGGVFKPVVGAGAQYAVTAKDGEKHLWSYAVVGKETVEGAEGYWVEMRMDSGGEQRMIMKMLMVSSGAKPEVKRTIMQMGDQPPMEMPLGGMMARMRQGREPTPATPGLGEKVGTEMVTVPAGAFLCDHYRTQDPNGKSDLWVSTKVSPYGAVKVISTNMTMELTKVLSNETSQIKGEPKKFEMPRF